MPASMLLLRPRFALLVVTFGLVLFAASAGAFPLQVVSSFHSVEASAEARLGLRSDAQRRSDGIDTPPVSLPGSRAFAVDAAASVPPNGASADAGQSASYDASFLAGTGAANTAGAAVEPGAIAFAEASSFFRIVFTVAFDAQFTLRGFANAEAFGATSSAAFVSLVSLDPDLHPLDVHFEAPPGPQPFDASGVLFTGVEYELIGSASALADVLGAGAAGGGSASFEVRLEVVPEPATVLVLGLGLAGLSARRRRG